MDRTIEAKYDEIAEWYAEWIRATRWTVPLIKTTLLSLCGEFAGQRILDVACGEGTFSRRLAENGACVTGIDISEKLLGIARGRGASEDSFPEYALSDAQSLAGFDDRRFDGAVCVMALMDISDLRAVYASVRRVVRDNGWFVIAITHPCFDSPHAEWLNGEVGGARVVGHYLDEGPWRSRASEGVRNRVEANHRTLSTYLNDAIAAGWTLERLLEPVGGLPGQNPSIPRLLFARFRAA